MSDLEVKQEGVFGPQSKRKPTNSIISAVECWFRTLPEEILSTLDFDLNCLLSITPKRWVTYYPMVLLPSGSFGPNWSSIIQLITTYSTHDYMSELWTSILFKIGQKEGKGVLTHLAINSGIPRESFITGDKVKKNILRTPSGLIPLYGDFGPDLLPTAIPNQQDFEKAFWVRAKQNGIIQIWAPRYTMFSRGNIKEKERLLKFHNEDKLCKEALGEFTAVDLYAGIGYFVFSYVKMGIGKVFGWELNPWSVEGLRRGALENGWSIKIIRPGDEVSWTGEKILVFLEDNNKADIKLRMLEPLVNIKHVNCGLLPTSLDSWKTALICVASEGWLHLHENVGENCISTRRSEVEKICENLVGMSEIEAKVKHVELVKTFAPQIWHCVFDVFVKNHIKTS